MNHNRFRDWAARLWGLEISRACPEYDIQGSPERSLSRAVIEDDTGRLFLLEKFAKDKFEVRSRVVSTLCYLNRRGLSPALAPEPAHTGEFLPFFDNACFQISRFLDSTALARPQWIESAEIGDQMGAFLVDMHWAAAGIEGQITYPGFSIKTYIYKLFEDMAGRHSKVRARYLPILGFLEKGFMDAHDSLVQQFCHGDFHPLNVIWHHKQVKAVIDWEFTGVKPDVYDAANLVGCAGIEHPEGLVLPMVTRFLSRIKGAGIISDIGWQWFPEYVLALRFAWLSEWLRKEDARMLGV